MLPSETAAATVAPGQDSDQNSSSTFCASGTKIPLFQVGTGGYAKRKIDTEQNSLVDNMENSAVEEISLLDSVVLAKWEECAIRGLFRYDVTACETKVLAGENGFIAQLNEGRHSKKRPTEFRVDQVLQPFDKKKFNFTKVGLEEVLFRFEESVDWTSEYFEDAAVEDSSPNVVVINVSPIEYGHVLLVPRVMDCIPQRLDVDNFILALHMASEVNNPYFRLGYNSLGAFATINHLHFQGYYLNVHFAIERAPTIPVAHGPRGTSVTISELADYPVKALVYENASCLEEMAEVVTKACVVLQNNNIPYNVLISDMGSRIFLIPQCFAERQARGEVEQVILDTQVNPAVWEISGHIVLKRKEDYDMATEDYAWKLLAEVSLSETRFREVTAMCLQAAKEDKTYGLFAPDYAENNAAIPEDDGFGLGSFRNIAKYKAKARNSMTMESLCNEYILPRA